MEREELLMQIVEKQKELIDIITTLPENNDQAYYLPLIRKKLESKIASLTSQLEKTEKPTRPAEVSEENEFNSPVINKIVSEIKPIRSNFEYCAEHNVINGTLYVDIKNAMIKYRKLSLPQVSQNKQSDDDDEIDLSSPDFHHDCTQCGNSFWSKTKDDVICESCKSSITIKPDAEKQVSHKTESAEEIDLMQYVTNLLYYAHVEAMSMHSIDFDKWVEDHVDNLNEYFAQSHQVSQEEK